MTYGKMGKNTMKRLQIPRLDGGVHYQPEADRIGDNQLAECQNLWWKDGALRTRPGIHIGEQGITTAANGETRIFAREDATKKDEEGEPRPVRRYLSKVPHPTEPYTANGLGYLDYGGKRGRTSGGYTTGGNTEVFFDYLPEPGDIGGLAAGGCMILDGGGKVYTLLESGQYADITAHAYAPILVRGAGGCEAFGAVPKNSGEAYESRNMLTGQFRAQYTVGQGETCFYLPVKNLDQKPVTATYMDISGLPVTHTVPANAMVGEKGADGKVMHCLRPYGCVYFTDDSGAASPLMLMGENSLTITAWKEDDSLAKKVYGMRFCTWFGGDRSTHGSGDKPGGSRLFLSGNPLCPGIICWSAGGNPLYFPEENMVLVGDAGQAVTAFAQHGGMLLIFKEREIYAASYAADGRASAGLPVSMVEGGVGCSCPDTISRWGSRLVWAYGGKVYGLDRTLKTAVLSDAIENVLAWIPFSVWKQASAGCYQGYYLLLLGEDIWAMGLPQNAGGQEAPAWYRWKWGNAGGGVPIRFIRLLAQGEEAVLLGLAEAGNKTYEVTATLSEGGEDTVLNGLLQPVSRPIACSFATKLYDFGLPEKIKTVRRTALAISGPGTAGARFYTCSEWGKKPEVNSLRPTGWEPGPVVERSLSAGADRVRRYGLAVETQGSLSVGGILAECQVFGD